jgi:hypothetical protein
MTQKQTWNKSNNIWMGMGMGLVVGDRWRTSVSTCGVVLFFVGAILDGISVVQNAKKKSLVEVSN